MKRAIVVSLVLLFAFAVCSCGSQVQDRGVVTMVVTATLAPTIQETATQEPTATGTPTAVPANTATSTPVPMPTDDDVDSYLVDVINNTEYMAEGLGQISDLFSYPRLNDSEWVNDVAIAIIIIRTAHESLAEMDPPESMSAIHARLIDATSDCSQATYYIVSGIDNMDSDDLGAATTLITSCSDKLSKLTDDLVEAMSKD